MSRLWLKKWVTFLKFFLSPTLNSSFFPENEGHICITLNYGKVVMPALLCLLWKETWVKKELLVLRRIWESAMQKSSPSNTLPIKIYFPAPRAIETHDLSWNWAEGSTSPVRYKVVISVPNDQLQVMVKQIVWGMGQERQIRLHRKLWFWELLIEKLKI